MTALIIVALCVAGIGGVGFCGCMAASRYVDENRADDLLPTDDQPNPQPGDVLYDVVLLDDPDMIAWEHELAGGAR